MQLLKRPGGELASRPLHFIWIADCSGSMSGDKIQQLNFAIRESIPAMRDVANENPNADVLVRALKFANGAQWHVGQATKVANFEWLDLKADGLTDMGKALKMVAEQLKMPPMSERALPPVLVLLSDGQPTDNFEEGLQALLDLPWGKKAVKIAIAIGEDADTDVLQQFMGSNSELKPLIAKNAEQLVNYIKWASTAVLKAASSPVSQTVALPQGVNVPVPAPPTANISSADDVW